MSACCSPDPEPASTLSAQSPGHAPRTSRRTIVAGGLSLGLIGALAACEADGPKPSRRESSTATAKPSKLEIVLLGTAGGPPNFQNSRSGISTALMVDGRCYIVDCGRSAVTQFHTSGLTFDSINGIFITHLHADHVADYYNFFLLGGFNWPHSIERQIPVYGPGRAGGLPKKFGGGTAPIIAPELPTPGTADLTDRCHEAFAYSSNIFIRDSGISDIRSLIDVHEISLPDVGASFRNTAPPMAAFPVMSDDRVRVSATLVPHGPVFPAFAYRFDTEYGSVTFSGDTTYTDNLITLAKDSDVLIHEATNLEGADMPPALYDHQVESHVSPQKVGTIAQKAGVPQLVLSHLADATGNIDPAQWERWAKQGYTGEVTVGEDLQRIALA